MNFSLPHPSPRALAGLAIAAAVVLFGGCLEPRLVWSPDGQQAAVLSQDELRFCTADGTLSNPPIPNVHLVTWLGDSQRLLVARSCPAPNWVELARRLGAARSQQIVAEAEAIWEKVQQGAEWGLVTMDIGGKNPLPRYCLRELHGSELRPRLSADQWKALVELEAHWMEIVLARRQGAALEIGEVLFSGEMGKDSRIVDLRLAPGERTLAFTLEARKSYELFAVALTGAKGPVQIAANVAAFPDWAVDGRSLVYLQADLPNAKDRPTLAVIQQREVFDAQGRLALAREAKDLGGCIFQPLSRIRCLSDGRIVFNATPLILPVSGADFEAEREQLFAFDLARQATLVRLIPQPAIAKLPQLLSFFDPSPDGNTLLIGGLEGEVCLFTLATGQTEEVQAKGKGAAACRPSWRGPGEFTYLKRMTTEKGKPPPPRDFEVVLRRGDQETLLSNTWPEKVLEGVVK